MANTMGYCDTTTDPVRNKMAKGVELTSMSEQQEVMS